METNLVNRRTRQSAQVSQASQEQAVITNLNKARKTKKAPSSTDGEPTTNSKGWLPFAIEHISMLIMTVRTLSVIFNLVWDCDEVYNYWEPLHFVLFGNGFQTWEYSPAYSLRSYLYIYLHALPLWPFKSIVSSKITLFYMLRFGLAFLASKLETYLFHQLLAATRGSKVYAKLAYVYIALSLSNAGMFLSLTSFLPSTFAMYLVMLAYASWLTCNNSRLAIFSIGLAVLLGWPFVAILGVPLALDMCGFSFSGILFSASKLAHFTTWTIISGITIALPLVTFDSYFFGKTVIAPLNIFMYNVFPANPNQGPDLYGREPLSFYILNCILNFNILFPLMCLTVFSVIVFSFINTDSATNQSITTIQKQQKLDNKLAVMLAAMFLWFLVFFTRPHKEERFLYPVYPLMLISASMTIVLIQSSLAKLFKSQGVFSSLVNLFPYAILALHALFSLMRVVALYKNFASSMQIYEILNKPEIKFSHPILDTKETISVCVEKEWYRFPSSFFIPENLEESVKKQHWRLRFVESHFKGQLPGMYNERLPIPASTRYVDKLFNDMNKEVRERYLDIKKCDFLIDTDTIREENDISELALNGVRTRWKTLAKLPFIDMGTKSERFLRAFYVPYLYENRVPITFFKLRIRI